MLCICKASPMKVGIRSKLWFAFAYHASHEYGTGTKNTCTPIAVSSEASRNHVIVMKARLWSTKSDTLHSLVIYLMLWWMHIVTGISWRRYNWLWKNLRPGLSGRKQYWLNIESCREKFFLVSKGGLRVPWVLHTLIPWAQSLKRFRWSIWQDWLLDWLIDWSINRLIIYSS